MIINRKIGYSRHFFFILFFNALALLNLQGCGSVNSISLPPLDPSAYSTAPTDWDEISIISDMFSEINAGFQESSALGFEAVFRHIYPNSLDLEKAVPCAQSLVDGNVTWELFFNESGASLLTNWVAPASSEEDWKFTGQTPRGNTYITNIAGGRTGGVTSIRAGMGFVHITVFDGQAYLFSPFCGDKW